MSEVLADKIVSFPRSLFNKDGSPVVENSPLIRHRDIWDISWLIREGATLNPQFVNAKLNDYGVSGFDVLLKNAEQRLPEIIKGQDFMNQMNRFIDSNTLKETIHKSGFLSKMQVNVISMFTKMAPQLALNVE